MSKLVENPGRRIITPFPDVNGGMLWVEVLKAIPVGVPGIVPPCNSWVHLPTYIKAHFDCYVKALANQRELLKHAEKEEERWFAAAVYLAHHARPGVGAESLAAIAAARADGLTLGVKTDTSIYLRRGSEFVSNSAQPYLPKDWSPALIEGEGTPLHVFRALGFEVDE